MTPTTDPSEAPSPATAPAAPPRPADNPEGRPTSGNGPAPGSTTAERHLPGGTRGQRGRTGAGKPTGRRRASLSVETIVDTAIAMLDRDGAQRLTLRGLAAELNSGVASLYWYASGKDELMAMVADEVLGRALHRFHELRDRGQLSPEQFAEFPALEPDPRTSPVTRAALGELRLLSLCLFSEMLEHRWLAGQLLDAGPDEENALRTWEYTGRILQRMELDAAQQFHASLAITNYASGMGAEISHRQDLRDAEDAEEMFREQLERWDHVDTGEFPFVHSVLDQFRRHDDRAEYMAGLNLLLSGLERLTWSA
ncbi:TetR/AcrR family transcriptional regulator [Kocuria sp.]|uniref:TetR/AcrR family transcriptional regulator n=1 Tax=Kocuria sp. TaxID=1871328 RepID=UPI0026DBC60A|nr:TetR/AcrR family transcriptional regulator C-terminal domain-containing protein [Kocuria sp.]MDO4918226.1 TetR/AcrR family transcriptional regulator C-terminal domain-containing protein [Kocuria sp.]